MLICDAYKECLWLVLLVGLVTFSKMERPRMLTFYGRLSSMHTINYWNLKAIDLFLIA